MLGAISEYINSALAAGALVAGIAYAIGQFISAKRRGEGDALSVAVQEVEAIKLRADRLEKELIGLQGEMHALRKENESLRSVITTRNDLDQKLIDKLEESVQRQTRRLVDVIREERGKV